MHVDLYDKNYLLMLEDDAKYYVFKPGFYLIKWVNFDPKHHL